MRSSRTRAAFMVTVAGALGVVAAPPAIAAQGRAGQRAQVCAKTLTLRDRPGGRVLGTLREGATFKIQSLEGEWVKGHAFGGLNRDGYVLNGWFCDRDAGGEFIP